ncbi:hypothetical protein NFJ02_11g05750 [Pycnococcus provasolii]|mmetsp:Transcript_496/g.1182  ORF Transcript_496/g.1182 Transcript_496/m.1182 type:complete len:113 (-) Transcript_496:123-461(-)
MKDPTSRRRLAYAYRRNSGNHSHSHSHNARYNNNFNNARAGNNNVLYQLACWFYISELKRYLAFRIRRERRRIMNANVEATRPFRRPGPCLPHYKLGIPNVDSTNLEQMSYA